MLIGGQPDLRLAAAWALGRIGDPAAIAPLQWTFTAGEPLLQLRSARALAALGDDSIAPELSRRATGAEGDGAIRRAYVDALESLESRRRRPELALQEQLRDLRRSSNPRRLVAALWKGDFVVRYEAIVLASQASRSSWDD